MSEMRALTDSGGVMPWAVFHSTCFSRRPRGLVHGALHRAGDVVGLINGSPCASTLRAVAADGLDERCLRAQKTLLVGIENRHP